MEGAFVVEEVLDEGCAGEGSDGEATMEDLCSQYSAPSPGPIIVIDDDEEEEEEVVSTGLLFWFCLFLLLIIDSLIFLGVLKKQFQIIRF